MSFMFHSPNRTRIPDVAVLRSQPKTWVRFPFRTALRIPMLIPVYAVSSCYHPAIVDESTTTRNPPGQITGLDDRRLLHHHDSYLGNVKQKLVYPFIENENCRHNLSCFFFTCHGTFPKLVSWPPTIRFIRVYVSPHSKTTKWIIK